MLGCRNCGRAVHQTIEKALEGEPREALVWADDSGGWVCERTGDEHRADPHLTPFEVEFTVIVHVLAENDEVAFGVAEPRAVQAATDMAWSSYDDCVRQITEGEF